MRHRVYGKKLGRNKNERTALFKSLVQQLFLHGTITTSETKAKAIKGMVDKIINLAKSKNSKRLLSAYFAKDIQDRLVKEILPKLGTRTSGYTSQIRTRIQVGDNATIVKMSLIGAEHLKPPSPTKLGEQTTSKKTKEIKEARNTSKKKVAPAKKIASRKPIIRRRTSTKK